MIISVDFDGTCVSHKFPDIGKDIGAVPVLLKIVNSGNRLILNTMRPDDKRNLSGDIVPSFTKEDSLLYDAVKWFKDNNIPLYGINSNPSQSHWTNSPKVYAHIYIDDANLGCPLVYEDGERPYVDWREVEKILVTRNVINESI